VPHDITTLPKTSLSANMHRFTRAAISKCVKQASLSKRISLLESRSGITLFMRSTRSPTYL